MLISSVMGSIHEGGGGGGPYPPDLLAGMQFTKLADSR